MRLAYILAIVPAFIFSQAPAFMQNYYQRIGGAADELDRIVQHFDEDSRRSGYDRTSALNVMAKNPEQLIRDQAVRMNEAIARLGNLRIQQRSLKEGGAFERVATFIATYDPPLAQRTWDAYAFALPLSTDGLLFAGVGYIVTLLGLLLLSRLFRDKRLVDA